MTWWMENNSHGLEVNRLFNQLINLMYEEVIRRILKLIYTY